ncbi:MAG TPA: TonB-dependent receptor, partial [Anseongella sp.]|nr:TonB-dependent receptor [Anseongella sp.]
NYYGKGFNFSSQTAWQTNHRYYTEPIDGDFSPIDGITVVNNYGKDWNNVKVATQEFRFSSAEPATSRFRWTAGLYGFYQDNPVRQGTHFGADAEMVGGTADLINTTLININEGTGFGVALYGQGTYSLSPELELTAGLRYDHETKELNVRGEAQYGEDPPAVFQPDTATKADFSAFSPKVSLAYAFSEQHRAYLSYSRGFRAGGLTQFSSLEQSSPPLYPYKPEYSDNFEAGVKNIFARGRLRLNFSAFYTKVSDAQVPTLILPEAFTVTRNAGELESKGVEVEVASTLLKGLDAVYNFGYTDAKFTNLQLPGEDGILDLNGNRQIFTPEVTSMLSLQYTYQLPSNPGVRLVAGGQWQYLGSQYFDLKN